MMSEARLAPGQHEDNIVHAMACGHEYDYHLDLAPGTEVMCSMHGATEIVIPANPLTVKVTVTVTMNSHQAGMYARKRDVPLRFAGMPRQADMVTAVREDVRSSVFAAIGPSTVEIK
jgi:hypothetical protein